MYHKLRVRFPWSNQYEDVAIDDINIDIVKPGGKDKSLAYDMDGVPVCEIGMDYDELVARLNDEEWDAKQPPEPVVVSRWAWVDLCGNLVYTGTEDEVKRCVLRASGYAVELKGEYTP